MSHVPERPGESDWQPATSQPGENYTIEGQIRLYGAFTRGMKNRDPRLKEYRSSMWRTALAVVGAGIVLIAVIALVQALL